MNNPNDKAARKKRLTPNQIASLTDLASVTITDDESLLNVIASIEAGDKQETRYAQNVSIIIDDDIRARIVARQPKMIWLGPLINHFVRRLGKKEYTNRKATVIACEGTLSGKPVYITGVADIDHIQVTYQSEPILFGWLRAQYEDLQTTRHEDDILDFAEQEANRIIAEMKGS